MVERPRDTTGSDFSARGKWFVDLCRTTRSEVLLSRGGSKDRRRSGMEQREKSTHCQSEPFVANPAASLSHMLVRNSLKRQVDYVSAVLKGVKRSDRELRINSMLVKNTVVYTTGRMTESDGSKGS